MKKKYYILLIPLAFVMLLSCNQNKTETPGQIENTIVSIALLNDTVGYDLEDIRKTVDAFNKVIDDIGYPDAGYDIFQNLDDSSEIMYLHVGNWPDMETYKKIHEDQRYIDLGESNTGYWQGMVQVDYQRFRKVISR